MPFSFHTVFAVFDLGRHTGHFPKCPVFMSVTPHSSTGQKIYVGSFPASLRAGARNVLVILCPCANLSA